MWQKITTWITPAAYDATVRTLTNNILLIETALVIIVALYVVLRRNTNDD
jgi:hypothetical protein